MKKAYILILLLFIAAAAILAFSYNKNKQLQASSQSMANFQTAINANPITVDYTDKGFSPNNLTVTIGQKILFKNDSSGGLWVASGPHPYDDAYPEFNANRAYPPGEDYIFTFGRTGIWSFHNHLQESDTGTVVVNP